MFRWFETRIDAFPEDPPARPPDTLLAFYVYFIKPVWPVFAVLLVAGFLGSLIEVSLLAFVGSLVDMMKAAETPEAFLADHWGILLWMAFVAMVARPVVSTAHDLIKNQIIAGPVANRVRWLTHRYVLRQSLSFFQNDFAGRVANKIMQAAPALRDSVVQLIDAIWYAAVQWVGAAVIFAAADWRLLLPLIVWLAAYMGALLYFVPRIKERSTEAAEARSMLVGRIVDSYTNILTVKLFAHAEREDGYARDALDEQMTKCQASLRLQTSMELVLYTLNGFLIVSATALAVWLWGEGLVTVGAIAVVTGLVCASSACPAGSCGSSPASSRTSAWCRRAWRPSAARTMVLDAPDSKPLAVRAGEIRFDDVSFHYGRTAEAAAGRRGGIIHDFSLLIRPGEKVGIVGRSGAGKSTLVNLLLRFYDLESGRILIDGQDIAHVTQDSLRAQIGMVTQDTSLLHRSVRDNILYGRPDAGRGGGDRGRQEGAGRRVHRRARGPEGPQGLLGPRRRARREAVRRPAPAHRHRPRAAEGRADPDPRRGHQRARLGGGAGHPGAALQPDGRQDGDRHRPPPLHHRRHGPAGDHGPGPHRRAGQRTRS